MPAPQDSVIEKERVADKTQQPPMYKVILINDDYTPFDFVIDVVQRVFNKTLEQSIELAARIHQEGQGVCGVYPKDIAEHKQKKAIEWARAEEHPLECRIQPETPAPAPRGMRP